MKKYWIHQINKIKKGGYYVNNNQRKEDEPATG